MPTNIFFFGEVEKKSYFIYSEECTAQHKDEILIT
jgi:hypothetical protein